MIRNYKPSVIETVTEHEVRFFIDRDGGFAFPCDQYGKLFPDTNEAAKQNYAYCMANPDKFPYAWNEVKTIRRSWRTTPTGDCECGHNIMLTNDYHGACECPYCGKWYNLFGQELLAPSKWEEAIEYDY